MLSVLHSPFFFWIFGGKGIHYFHSNGVKLSMEWGPKYMWDARKHVCAVFTVYRNDVIKETSSNYDQLLTLEKLIEQCTSPETMQAVCV